MKFKVFAISFLIAAISSTALASSPEYYRGTLFAIDTREHRGCADMQKQLRSLSKSKNIETLCQGNSQKPMALILVYSKVAELEFIAEAGAVVDRSPNIVSPIQANKETGHNLRLHAYNQSNQIEIKFTEANSLMNSRSTPATFKLPFVMKTDGRLRHKTSLLAKILSFEMVHAKSRSQSKTEEDKSLSLHDVINRAFQKAIENDRASIDLFQLPDLCESRGLCSDDSGFGIGISINIKF